MKLVELHTFNQNHEYFKELDNLCFLSKNLYNSTLFAMKQHFFDTGKSLTYFDVNKLFTHSKQQDYTALPAKVSKGTQRLVWKNMLSFFALIKKKDNKARPPKYLDSVKGRQVVHYEKGALSFVKKEGYIHLSKTNIYIKTSKGKDVVQFVRIVPRGNHINVEVGYNVTESEPKIDNQRYASIDLGINNLMTITSNIHSPYIINGKPLKSINQYYNKKLAQYRSELKKRNNKHNSKKIMRLTKKRNFKVKDYIHKSTTYVVNQLVSNQINTLVIGYNKGWKQDITLGKQTNQKFVNIPYLQIINTLKYKCQLKGIKVVIREESYTSKCSFIDNEDVKKQIEYKGKRVYRGLFKTNNGLLINSDVNGSLNILKKHLLSMDKNVVQKFSIENILKDCIDVVCSTQKIHKVSMK